MGATSSRWCLVDRGRVARLPWQLEAWQERRAAEAVDLTESTPVPLADVFGPDDPFPEFALGRPVKVSGTWRPTTPSSRGPDGGPERPTGYWVVTR